MCVDNLMSLFNNSNVRKLITLVIIVVAAVKVNKGTGGLISRPNSGQIEVVRFQIG